MTTTTNTTNSNSIDNHNNNWIINQMLYSLHQRHERGMLRTLQYDTDNTTCSDTISTTTTTTEQLQPQQQQGRLHYPHHQHQHQHQHQQQQQQQQQEESLIIDFSSNDYLGLAHDLQQEEFVQQRYFKERKEEAKTTKLGSTGSRLLSGDSPYFHTLETYIALTHQSETALICNSGYDANLTVISSLPCSCLIYDEYVHNSIHMGMRLWKTSSSGQSSPSTSSSSSAPYQKECYSFKHNDVHDLQKQFEFIMTRDNGLPHSQQPKIVVIVESVYSMDGDIAPLPEILDMCKQHNAYVVVDEAHGFGVFGSKRNTSRRHTTTTNSTVTTTTTTTTIPPLQHPQHDDTSMNAGGDGGTGLIGYYGLQNHPNLLCTVVTYGKGGGCHGASILCSKTHKQYLINYGYPFIYSTSLPYHSLLTIQCAYETICDSEKGNQLRQYLFAMISLFRRLLTPILNNNDNKDDDATTNDDDVYLLPSKTPIQALMISGNERCTQFCQLLYDLSNHRIRLYPIKSPTVEQGKERIRIIIHSHNTSTEIHMLVNLIQCTLQKMKLSLSQPLLNNNNNNNISTSPTTTTTTRRNDYRSLHQLSKL